MFTEYKTIQFTRSDNISVSYKVEMLDVYNANENFLILDYVGAGIHAKREVGLFYWIKSKSRWTLNEWIFFALNKNMCIHILDKNGVELVTYGVCGNNDRVFGLPFGINFN